MENNITDSNSQSVINWLIGGFMALFGAILGIYRKKIDALQEGHADLRAEYVTRADLNRHLDAIATQRREMHAENAKRLERIEDGVKEGLARIHDRIDSIPFRSAGSRTRATDEPTRARDERRT